MWTASSDYVNDIAFSDESLTRAADTYRRLRNTARFLLAYLHDFNFTKNAVSTDKMLALDRWAVDIPIANVNAKKRAII